MGADPVTSTFHDLAIARSLGVASRLGVFNALAEGPLTVELVAARLNLEVGPLRMVLDLLAGVGLLDVDGASYSLSEAGGRWFDPDSSTSVGTFISNSLEYWDSWANLEGLLVGATPAARKPDARDELRWLRLTRARYEFARRFADEVAFRIDLPASARSVIDVGGSHGWFSAALCKSNEQLRATVIDDEPSVTIAREIMWETGMLFFFIKSIC